MLERVNIVYTDDMARKHQGPEDFAEAAFRVFQQATGEPQAKDPRPVKNPAAVELGRLGGKKGGLARAANLTAEQRSEIAKKAAANRWNRSEPT